MSGRSVWLFPFTMAVVYVGITSLSITETSQSNLSEVLGHVYSTPITATESQLVLAQGLAHFSAASIAPKENSVCICSRLPFVPRTYPNLSLDDRRRLVGAHFEDIEVFGVYFAQNQAKASLFQFLIDGAYKPAELSHLFIGDFNTGLHGIDEKGSTFYCAEHFSALPKAGLADSWRSRNPTEKEFSWYSQAGNGFRIDHVFSSAAADSQIQSVYYDHIPRESGITDHSALVVGIAI